MVKFRRTKVEPKVQERELYNRPGRWPSGAALRTPDGQVWFIKGQKRYRCFSPRTTWSWQFRIIDVAPEALSKTQIGGVLGFRDGTLIKDVSDAKIYLVSDSKLRHVTNPDLLDLFGEPLLVSHDEVKIHIEGEQISGL